MTGNGFDRIASIYDRLARLVFGNSIKRSQTHFVGKIPLSSEVLILGGGTGWILPELFRHDSRMKITYIDSSLKMISKARQHATEISVEFIFGTERDIPLKRFDVVIMPFFLDIFPTEKLKIVIELILLRLKSGGLWFVSDFVNTAWWHKIYLWIMYRFFRVICNIEARKLPEWLETLNAHDLDLISTKKFFNGFICSAIYKKSKS